MSNTGLAQTREQILAMLNERQNKPKISLGLEINTGAREVTTSDYTQELVVAQELQQAQEVYKDRNIKRYKDTSCESDRIDVDRFKNRSDRTAELQVVPATSSSCATTSSYTGISVQHYITKSGIKLNVSLQTPECAPLAYQMTVELKRYDRLHQIKSRQGEDAEWFAEHLAKTIDDIRESKGYNVCLGRAHEKGKRAEWYANTFVTGVLDGDIIRYVLLNIEGQEYEVHLTHELSPTQQKFYHSTGIYGSIKKGAKRAPRISDIVPTKFGD